MTDWLLTNLDELLGLIIGFTTVGAFWFAYKGRNSTAAVIGLSGNALWWAYAITVGTWMLILPITAMTCIHTHNLRLALRRRTHNDQGGT